MQHSSWEPAPEHLAFYVMYCTVRRRSSALSHFSNVSDSCCSCRELMSERGPVLRKDITEYFTREHFNARKHPSAAALLYARGQF